MKALFSKSIYVLLWFALGSHGYMHAQTTKKPYCLSYGNQQLFIEKVELTEKATKLHLIHNNTKREAVSIAVKPYIQIREKHSGLFYSMTRAIGIEISPNSTYVAKATGHRFILEFPPLQGGCYEFDLFECPEAGCYNVEGIQIKNSLPKPVGLADKKFQRAYDYMSYYRNGTWGEWQKGNYRFVFNINKNDDFRLYKSDAEALLYQTLIPAKRVEVTPAGSYQQSQVRETKSGEVVEFRLYDNGDVMMSYQNGTAYQFSN